MDNYYTTLEIEPDATSGDIRAAYRRLALQWHPDKNPTNHELATTKFKQISAAYEVLSDTAKRSAYDRRGTQSQAYNQYQHGYKYNPPEPNPFSDTFFQTQRQGSGQDFSFGFGFRSPEDIFKDFFKDHPAFDSGLFGPGSGMNWNQQQSSQPNVSSYSTSSASHREFVNGKVMETRTKTVNNVRTTEVYEDGVLVSSHQGTVGDGGGTQSLFSTNTSTSMSWSNRSRSKPKSNRH